MNFDYLEGFLEVAKVRNFSRAASILYRTQPTLSQQIQRLEREFGGKLFDRDFKAVRLTQAPAAACASGPMTPPASTFCPMPWRAFAGSARRCK